MKNIRDITLEHNGVERTLRDWADLLGIEYAVVRMRYSRGMRDFNSLFSSPRGYKAPQTGEKLAKANIRDRVEKLEQRVEALKQVVLQITERLENHE